MKIEDISGLMKRAVTAKQLKAQIDAIREQITLVNNDLVIFSVSARWGCDGLQSLSMSSCRRDDVSGLDVHNANPDTMRAAILGVLQSELDARLAALEAL